jgi:hypothetical protein
MAAIVLNSSLASGLGRPELAYRAQSSSAVQTGVPMAPPSQAAGGGTFSFETRGPLIALFIMVAGVAVFAWWVHPRLL